MLGHKQDILSSFSYLKDYCGRGAERMEELEVREKNYEMLTSHLGTANVAMNFPQLWMSTALSLYKNGHISSQMMMNKGFRVPYPSLLSYIQYF